MISIQHLPGEPDYLEKLGIGNLLPSFLFVPSVSSLSTSFHLFSLNFLPFIPILSLVLTRLQTLVQVLCSLWVLVERIFFNSQSLLLEW